jgi:LPS-assembly lipoprotein
MMPRLLTAISLVLLLSACGFALRGSDRATLPFDTLVLNLQQENSPLGRTLRLMLEAAGVQLTDAGYTLSVAEELNNTRPLSVTSRASAAEYELTSTVRITVHDPAGAAVLGPEVLSVRKVYFEDIANIAGSGTEVELLRAEMRQELVEQLLRRLQSLDAPPAHSASGR